MERTTRNINTADQIKSYITPPYTTRLTREAGNSFLEDSKVMSEQYTRDQLLRSIRISNKIENENDNYLERNHEKIRVYHRHTKNQSEMVKELKECIIKLQQNKQYSKGHFAKMMAAYIDYFNYRSLIYLEAKQEKEEIMLPTDEEYNLIREGIKCLSKSALKGGK